jgi:hypothetical protein
MKILSRADRRKAQSGLEEKNAGAAQSYVMLELELLVASLLNKLLRSFEDVACD